MPRKPRLLRTGTLALLLLLHAAPAVAQDRPRAITRVNVVDVDDGSLHPEQTVPVEGNRITRVGPAADIAVPDSAEVIDGRG